MFDNIFKKRFLISEHNVKSYCFFFFTKCVIDIAILTVIFVDIIALKLMFYMRLYLLNCSCSYC